MIYFKSNFFRIFLSQIFVTVGNFVVFIIISAHFGSNARGQYSLIISIFTLIGTILSFGVGKTIPSFLKNPKFGNNKIYLTYLIYFLVSCLVSIFVLIVISDLVKKNYTEIDLELFFCYLPILPYLIWYQYNSILFSSFNLIDLQKIISILSVSIFFIVLVFFVFFLNLGFKEFAIFHGGYFCVLTGIEIVLIFRALRCSFNFDILLFKQMLKNGLKIYIETLVGLTSSSFFTILLSKFFSFKVVGNFNFATQILSVLNYPSILIYQYFLNQSLITENYWVKQKSLIIKILIVLLVGIAIFQFFLFLFGNYLQFKDYELVPDILKILLLSSLFSYLNYLLYNQWLIKGLFFEYSLNNLISAVIAIPLSIVFFTYFGLKGATISYSFIYVFTLPGQLLLVNRLKNAAKGD